MSSVKCKNLATITSFVDVNVFCGTDGSPSIYVFYSG